ncbi:MAG: rhomboid family intramembrane serine protease [Geothrix sp.]|nr:rhomboid family intramembrane serine protease [Geothrix sp.]
MDPLALTAEAWREPWRLWTGHLVHFGGTHALANAIALAVPWILATARDRRKLALATVFIPPLLSLLLLPSLAGAEYRGASGLACALWALAGLGHLLRRESASVGALLLSGLALKLVLELALGTPFLAQAEGWQSLPQAHVWGALLGLGAALARPGLLRPGHPRQT